MQYMRHISRLSEVQLCGSPAHGSLRSHSYVTREPEKRVQHSIGLWVGYILKTGKSPNVTDPVLYFRSALAVISQNALTHPGQEVVEKVLSTAFQGNFSTKLNNSSLTDIYTNLGRALKTILSDIDKATAITPGFEDMVVIPDNQRVQIIKPQTGPLPKAGAGQRNALEEALGCAFIDYFNGYPVGDITEAFAGYGGTDLNIQNALLGAFDRDFTTSLKNADIGPYARNAMNTLAKNFGTALGKSINDHPGTLLPEFNDLQSLVPH
jgi:hypothetical protein